MPWELAFSEPVLVDEAPAKENGWGYYQFPRLARLPDASILLSFQIAEDSCSSYGKGGFKHFASNNEGKNWRALAPDEGLEAQRFFGSVELSNGDRLSLRTAKAAKTKELALPEPIGHTMCGYDGVTSLGAMYSWDALPSHLKGITQQRWDHLSSTWKEELAPVELSNDARVELNGLLPVIFFGDLRKGPEQSLYTLSYPTHTVNNEGRADPKCSCALYTSHDEGHSWRVKSRIPYEPDLNYDPYGDLRGGFTEPSFIFLGENDLLAVLRTTDLSPGPGPLYCTRSYDCGQTWTEPKPICRHGVDPHLLRLECGALILSYGRPGLELRVSDAADSLAWSRPYELVTGSERHPRLHTCGYSSLLNLDDDRFLVAYSEFYKPGVGEERKKALLVCEGRAVQIPSTVVSAPSLQDTEIVRSWYTNGQLRTETPVREDGCVHGICRSYYSSGELASETPYVDGKAHGIQTFYRKTGETLMQTRFDKGFRVYIQDVDLLGNIVNHQQIRDESD